MSARPKVLDAYCGDGGAGMGYWQAGYDPLGIDIEPHPNYPFPMVQADALDVLAHWDLSAFALIHASPPCQIDTQMRAAHRARGFDNRPDLLTPTRALILKSGKPYVIENVPGAKARMQATLILHGGMFGLGVHRPRLFECSELILAPVAPLTDKPVGVYGTRPVKNYSTRLNGNMKESRSTLRIARSLAEAQAAMGMPWGDWHGVKEAVPPAYTRYIAEQLMPFLAEASDAA